jgi:hypothetical protein
VEIGVTLDGRGGGSVRSPFPGKAHNFGGDWTSTKLDILGKYLGAYTTALKDKPTSAARSRNKQGSRVTGTVMARRARAASNLSANPRSAGVRLVVTWKR